MTAFPRITQDPAVMGGKPCIRGTRVTAAAIGLQIDAGRTVAEILADYPHLEHEDVAEALCYAAWHAQENGPTPDRPTTLEELRRRLNALTPVEVDESPAEAVRAERDSRWPL